MENTIRYTLYFEHNEISTKAFKQHDGDIIAALFEKDRDGGEPVKSFDTKEEALTALADYRCTYALTSGFAGVGFYSCDYYYVEEEEYDEDYDKFLINDEYSEFAEIEAHTDEEEE